MFNPKDTAMNIDECRYFLRRYSFGSLVTPDLQVSHVPSIFSAENFIETHLASDNPQLASLSNHVCLINILGPHAFISTSNYLVRPAVPTWNYASVSIKGRCILMAPQELSLSLDKMLAFFQPELLQDKETFRMSSGRNLCVA